MKPNDIDAQKAIRKTLIKLITKMMNLKVMVVLNKQL